MKFLNKISFLIFVLACLFSCSSKHTFDNDWERNNLHGKVAKTVEKFYPAKLIDGKYEKAKSDYSHEMIYKFDEKGNKTEEIQNMEEQRFFFKKVFIYKDDRLVEGKKFVENDKLSSRSEFVYENDKVVKVLYYDEKGKSNGYSIFEYPDDHKKVITNFDSQDKKTGHSEQEEVFGKYFINKEFRNGEIFFSQKTEFDKKGNRAKFINSFEDDEKMVANFEYLEFDSKGNWIRGIAKSINNENLIFSREIEYYD